MSIPRWVAGGRTSVGAPGTPRSSAKDSAWCPRNPPVIRRRFIFSGKNDELTLDFLGGGTPCLAGTFVGPFLTSPGWTNVLLAGILTGFLPCGLVYGFLTLASSSASVVHGLLTMLAFGAGTAPIMILTGVGGSLLSHSSRRHMLRVSAVCVLVTGLISLGRGIMFVQFPASAALESCPFCQ